MSPFGGPACPARPAQERPHRVQASPAPSKARNQERKAGEPETLEERALERCDRASAPAPCTAPRRSLAAADANGDLDRCLGLNARAVLENVLVREPRPEAGVDHLEIGRGPSRGGTRPRSARPMAFSGWGSKVLEFRPTVKIRTCAARARLDDVVELGHGCRCPRRPRGRRSLRRRRLARRELSARARPRRRCESRPSASADVPAPAARRGRPESAWTAPARRR